VSEIQTESHVGEKDSGEKALEEQKRYRPVTAGSIRRGLNLGKMGGKVQTHQVDPPGGSGIAEKQ